MRGVEAKSKRIKARFEGNKGRAEGIREKARKGTGKKKRLEKAIEGIHQIF